MPGLEIKKQIFYCDDEQKFQNMTKVLGKVWCFYYFYVLVRLFKAWIYMKSVLYIQDLMSYDGKKEKKQKQKKRDGECRNSPPIHSF